MTPRTGLELWVQVVDEALEPQSAGFGFLGVGGGFRGFRGFRGALGFRGLGLLGLRV